MTIDVSKVDMPVLIKEFYDRAVVIDKTSNSARLYRPGTLSPDECELEYFKARRSTMNDDFHLVLSDIRGRFVPLVISKDMQLDCDIWNKFYGPGTAEKIVQFSIKITEENKKKKENQNAEEKQAGN